MALTKNSERSASPALPKPGAREFYGGLAVITVLACVVMLRGGEPQTGVASQTGTTLLDATPPQDGPGEDVERAMATHQPLRQAAPATATRPDHR